MTGFLCPAFVKDEFSHPVESLALTVDEVINVRRVLVKAEMEKFLQSKELYNNLKRGKVRGWRSVCAAALSPLTGNTQHLSVFRSAAAAKSNFLSSRGHLHVYCAEGTKEN